MSFFVEVAVVTKVTLLTARIMLVDVLEEYLVLFTVEITRFGKHLLQVHKLGRIRRRVLLLEEEVTRIYQIC